MSKLMKVTFKLLDLMIIATMIFGPPMTALAAPREQPALVTIPSNFFTVVDSGGPNDVNSEQNDLTQMGRDDTDPSHYELFWSWDTTNFTAQKGNACALFDTNNNGNIDFAVCAEIENVPSGNTSVVMQTSVSPLAVTCSDKTPDRCSQPSNPLPFTANDIKTGDLANLAASPPANLVTDTDPFPNLIPDQTWPYDSTIRLEVLKSYLPANAVLVNVCTYPSLGNTGNNNPFDCVVTPGGGYLKIDKAAGSDTTTQFNFTVNPGSLSKSVTGTGTTGAFPMPVGTAYSVAETLVTGWDLTDAVCKLEDGTTVTGTKSGNTVSSITVQSGKITTCTFTNVKQVPQLTLVKTASPTTYSKVSDVISYSYAVTNSGNVKLAGPVTVVDDKATVNCPAVTTAGNLDSFLDPNESITCTASYTISQADINTGSVTNTATASAGGTNSNQDTETVTATQTKSLLLDKTADPMSYDSVGDVISYSYAVTNNGNVSLAGPVTVADNKATVTCPNVNTVGNLDNFLDPGESITCTASYTTTQADLDAGSVTNTAKASASGTYSNEDSVTVTATQTKSLLLVKTALPTTYSKVGDLISYSYEVKNTGNVTFAGPVTVTDNKATVSCPALPAGGLVPGASTTCTASYMITQSDLDSGSVINTAKASANGTDSNEDSETVNAVKSPALSLVKTASPSTYGAVGDLISYSYEVKNTGNVTLAGPVTVSDDKATVTCPAGGLAPGASMTCTASYTITQADLDSGSVTNTAKASANGTDSNQDSETVTAVQSPAIIVVKASTTTLIAKAGDVVPYTFEVTNGGNVTLTGITVSDPKCDAAPAYVSGDTNADNKLQTTEKWLYTCSHTVTQTEIDSDGGGDGDLDNTVTADSNESAPNTDDHFIPIDYSPAMTVEKSSTTTSLSAPSTVTYDYLVTNTGNVTLTGIVLTDNNDNDDMVCESDTLAVGKSMTCTATHTFTQDELDAGGTLDNTVAASSNEAPDATDSLSIPISRSAAILVVKASTTAQIAKAGDVVPYTFEVTNGGNVTLTGITVSDPMCDDDPAYVSGDDGDNKLQTTEKWLYTCDHTVTQAEVDSKGGGDGDLDNTVTADSSESEPATDDHAILITYDPKLNVVKSSTTTEITVAGQVVPYKFTVTNTGNVTLTGVTVTDPKCDAAPVLASGDTNTDGKLQLNETWIYTCNHTVTQAEIDSGGNLSNTVTAASNESGPDTDSLNIPITQSAAILVVKASTTTLIAKAGAEVLYTFEVTNEGNVTLTGITVTDPMCDVAPAYVSGDDNSDAKLQVDETWIFTCNHTVTQEEVDAGGNLINTVTADSVESDPDEDTLEIPVIQSPALAIDKKATESTYSAAGDVIHYSYVVTNSGNVTLYNITVADNKATVTCPDTSDGLAPADTITCSASYTIQQSDLDAGSLTNSAHAKSGDTQSPPDEVTIPATQSPAIDLAKTANPATYSKVGDVISYSYVIKNTGNVTLPGPFSITDDVFGTLSCPAGSLAPNATVTCTTSYTIKQTDLDAGKIKNTATASTTYDGKDVTSVPADATVTADQKPALTITKTATPTTYDATGDVISYSYKVENTGNVTISGPFVIYDDKATDEACPATPTSLAPGEIITCIASYTIKQADLDAGLVTNTAYATGSFDGKEVKSNTDSETVTADQMPALTINKTATPSTYSKVGDVISYSYLVTNSGNVTLYNITVMDNKATVFCPDTSAGLAPLGTITCTASYTIKQADLDSGSVKNTAYATDGTTQSEPDSETVNANQMPALTLDKTASPSTYDSVGDTISYSYKLTNTGNVTLSGPFTVADDKVTVTCPNTASLAPGAFLTCTASYTISQADLDGGSVKNTAKGKGSFNGTDVFSNEDSETVTADQKPMIDVEKLVSVDGGTSFVDADTAPGPYATEGSSVQFKFIVTNTGNVTLSGITLTDPDFNLSTCGITDPIAPNASFECLISTTAVPGQHTNTATADSSQSGPDTDDANYYGMMKGQPSIQIESLSITINKARTTVTGQFYITDQSTSATRPDGYMVAIEYYGVRWATKTPKAKTFTSVIPSGGCTYTIVSVDSQQVAGWKSGNPIIFDETVTIGYTCTFGSTQLPKGGTLKGIAYAGIFGRTGMEFTYSSTAAIPK